MARGYYNKNGNPIQKGKIPWNKGTKGLQVSWNKGISCGPLSKEHRKKISKSLMGINRPNFSEVHRKKLSESNKGKIPWNKGTKGVMPTPWNKGIPMKEESKKKLSESKLRNPTRYWLGKKRPDMMGENNCKWIGGSRSYYQVRARDIIKKEGIHIEGKLVHHINGNYKDNRQENLMIITRGKHTKLHHLQGDIIGGGRKSAQ